MRNAIKTPVLWLSLVLVPFASTTSIASSLFSVKPSSSNWMLRQDPGAEAIFVPKVKSSSGFQASINVIRDPSSRVYANIDGYMSDALRVLVESGSHQIVSFTKHHSSQAGEYYLLRSETDGRELLQGVFFRPGLGAYIVTGVASKDEFTRYQTDFMATIESARF